MKKIILLIVSVWMCVSCGNLEEMNIDPKHPDKPDRDRFVLSKGHTAPGYCAALAHRGYFR